MNPAAPSFRFALRLAAVLCAAVALLPWGGVSAGEPETVYRLQELDETAGTLREPPDSRERLFGVIDRLTFARPPQPPGQRSFAARFPQVWPRTEAVELTPVMFGLPSIGLPGWLTPMSGRIRGEYATDFTEDERIGGRLLLNTNSYLAIDAEGNRRRTDFRGGHHEFWNGDANVVFWLPKVKTLAMRAGAGAAWVLDNGQTDVGWNITYAADVFIKSPWLFSGEIDYGRITGQKLFHGQATIGVRYNRIELFTGYDYYTLGWRKVDGLIAGAGLWF